MNKTLSLRRDKLLKEWFHAALTYLIGVYREQELAHILGLGDRRSIVNKWLLRKSMPDDEQTIIRVIEWGIGIKLLNEIVIPAANAKMDELREAHELDTLKGSFDFLKARGESYSMIAEADSLSYQYRKVWRWDKGWDKWAQPREQNLADVFREASRGLIPDEALESMARRIKRMREGATNKLGTQIMGKAVRESGLRDEIYYSLFPIFEPLGVLPHLAKEVNTWRQWCAEYERPQQQALFMD